MLSSMRHLVLLYILLGQSRLSETLTQAGSGRDGGGGWGPRRESDEDAEIQAACTQPKDVPAVAN